MGAPKKHHFLPQFYLRRFADGREGLHQIEKVASARVIPTKVLKAGSKRDFHTLDWKGQDVDRSTIETRLSLVEDRQEKMLKELLKNPECIADWRSELSEFVSLMYHRVPAFKSSIERRLKDVMNSTCRSLLRNGKFPEPPESIKELIREKGDDIFDIQISNWKLVEQMFNLASSSPITGILDTMNCCVLSTEEESLPLVTSDSPVVFFDASHDPNSPYGRGFAHKSAEVSIPLSQSKLLIFSHSNIADSTLSKDRVRHFNQRMIVAANRFIYTPKTSKEFQEDMNLLYGQQAGFTISTLEHSDGAVFITKSVPVTEKHLKSVTA